MGYELYLCGRPDSGELGKALVAVLWQSLMSTHQLSEKLTFIIRSKSGNFFHHWVLFPS